MTGSIDRRKVGLRQLISKYVKIDSDRTCDLCRKKIGSTIFAVYPNLKVYHSKCAPNIHIDPKTGVDFISVGAITHSVKALDISLKFHEIK